MVFNAQIWLSHVSVQYLRGLARSFHFCGARNPPFFSPAWPLITSFTSQSLSRTFLLDQICSNFKLDSTNTQPSTWNTTHSDFPSWLVVLLYRSLSSPISSWKIQSFHHSHMLTSAFLSVRLTFAWNLPPAIGKVAPNRNVSQMHMLLYVFLSFKDQRSVLCGVICSKTVILCIFL